MPRVVDVAQRRAELTDAAARVIARSGLESATMRGIAAEAGWTTGALTHYFSDKNDLLLQTFRTSLDARRSRRAERAGGTARQRLRAALQGALPLDDDRRRHWLVTLACCTRAGGDERLAAAQRDAYREFRDHVTDLVREVGAGPADDPGATAERLIAVADGIAVQAMFDAESWPPERQIAALDAAVGGGSRRIR